MRNQISRFFSIKNLFSIASLSLVAAFSSSVSLAQSTQLPDNLPRREFAQEPKPPAVARPLVTTGDDLYCAGYIHSGAVSNDFKIIGAEQENTVAHLGQGDVIYINQGSSQNIKAEMLFAIIRPLGDFKDPYKKGNDRSLGVYVRELGIVRVMAVQQNTATARIIFSCYDLQFGDVLVPFAERRGAVTEMPQPLPRYQRTSGQKPGRIVLQREQKELISPRDVVYIDLGTDNGIKEGDKFTIFRHKSDDVNLFNFRDDDIVPKRSGGYESDKFKGGTYSNDHPNMARQKVKDTRPEIPQKVLGELVVIAVRGKSATAVVTRTTQEVHTGDHIEALQ